jgi:hypothetical protein
MIGFNECRSFETGLVTINTAKTNWFVPCLQLLVTGFSPQGLGFSRRLVRVGYVVVEVILGQAFPIVLLFTLSVLFHQHFIVIH